jgi:hypothetical protein
MIALLRRLLLLLLLALDWSADAALLAPAVGPLAKPWRSTKNVCASGGYQLAVLQQSRPDLGSTVPGPAADAAPPGSVPARDAAKVPSALDPIRHLYVFMSLRR